MIRYIIIITSLTFSTISYGQKTVLLSRYPQEVPKGKKWVISTNNEAQIELSSGTMNTGTMCNANFLSRPGVLSSIVEGDYNGPNKIYQVLFSGYNRVAYANEFTYRISPKAIVTHDFDFNELANKSVEEVGLKSISFLSGEKVYLSSCIITFPAMEYELSLQELEIVQLREDAKKKARIEREQYLESIKEKEIVEFFIPVNQTSDSKTPKIHDNNLYRIGFKTKNTLLKLDSGDSLSPEKMSVWTITLGNLGLTIQNSREYVRKFKVRSFEYDPTSSSSKFELSSNNNLISHNLFVSYSPIQNQYLLILKSIDGSEIFQFPYCNAVIKNDIKFDDLPSVVSTKMIYEAFFIRKQKNGIIKAHWVNEDKKIVNFSAVVEDHRHTILYNDIETSTIPTHLKSAIQISLESKSDGQYFLALNVEETKVELRKDEFETLRSLSINTFYKGTYGNPKEWYVRKTDR